MQRVVVQRIGPREQIIEDDLVAFEIALEQRLREIVLVAEMIEEPALGDACRRDQLVDRGQGEALVQHGVLGEIEDAPRVCSPLVRVRTFIGTTVPQVRFWSQRLCPEPELVVQQPRKGPIPRAFRFLADTAPRVFYRTVDDEHRYAAVTGKE